VILGRDIENMPPKKGKGKGSGGGEAADAAPPPMTAAEALGSEINADGISAVGVLASHPLSRDVKIEQFGLIFHGTPLLNEATLELNYGRRYGLLGSNGCGKTTLLRTIASREIPIPAQIDMYYLHGEVPPSDLTPMQIVSQADEERARLEKDIDVLLDKSDAEDMDANAAALEDMYERLDELAVEVVEKRAGEILHGLGFTHERMHMPARSFSGGWRMRIALARALFVSPTLLLLDEPTNHLDLEACVWLEEYLKRFKRILVVISHSQDFLNNVCNRFHLQP
jgi:ATP-binding cassette subfamily F protein 2